MPQWFFVFFCFLFFNNLTSSLIIPYWKKNRRAAYEHVSYIIDLIPPLQTDQRL